MNRTILSAALSLASIAAPLAARADAPCETTAPTAYVQPYAGQPTYVAPVAQPVAVAKPVYQQVAYTQPVYTAPATRPVIVRRPEARRTLAMRRVVVHNGWHGARGHEIRTTRVVHVERGRR